MLDSNSKVYTNIKFSGKYNDIDKYIVLLQFWFVTLHMFYMIYKINS